MACNIETMKLKVNGIIERIVQGNATSVVSGKKEYTISYGKQYEVKNRPDAYNMAIKRIAAVDKALAEEDINPAVFGPFLTLNQTNPNKIVLEKTGYPRLIRAYEIKNDAEARNIMVGEIIDEKEQTLNQAQVSENALREQEERDDIAFYRTATPTEILLKENPQNNLTLESTDNTRAREIASKLSLQLGVDFEIISQEQAMALTENSKNPWNGEPAFFIGSKVYFVGEQLSTNIILHEFAHPLIRQISTTNKPLFNSLYNSLKNTLEGQQIIQTVKALYPELKDDSPLFREEVIVRAIEREGAGAFKEDTGFRKVINDILYAIKQMLRRVFGQKSDVSKLNVNTTLEELTTMLTSGEQFNIETELISDEDISAYYRQQQVDINDLTEVKNQDVQMLINSVYTIASKHIKNLLENKEYDELANLLTDQFKRGDLEQLKGDLSKYQTVIGNAATKTLKDMEYQTQQSTALVNTLYRLDNMMVKILAHMEDIAKRPDDMINLNKAYYYNQLIGQWQGFIEQATEVLNDPENKIPNRSPLISLVANITTSTEKAEKIINKIYTDGARETLYSTLEPMGRNIKKRYDDIVAGLVKRKAPQSEIDKWHKEFYGLTQADYKKLQTYEKDSTSLSPEQNSEFKKLKTENAKGLEISKTKIEALLKGEAGDANYWNSYLEGYLYNTDPIIGGLALFVKNKMTEVMAIAQAKQNDFATDIKPLLDKMGIKFHNIGELGKRLGELDVIGHTPKEGDNEGVFGRKDVWSLLSKFKGHRYAVDELDNKVKVAHAAWVTSGSDVDRATLVRAVADRKKHLRQWFYQEYSERYYEREALLEKDDIGEEASYRREEALEKIKLLSGRARTQTEQLEITDELDKLWSDYRQLTSLYNLDGTRKEGFELSVAERLIEYSEASREFHDFVKRPGVFENALKSFEQELIQDGTELNSPAYKTLRNEWIRANTRIRIKPAFYVRRQELLDEVKEIMSKIENSSGIDMSAEWEEILELSAGFRDDDGQVKGSEMSPRTISDIKALQEILEEKRKNIQGRSGLTPNELSRLSALKAFKKERGLVDDEKVELKALLERKASMGLTKGQKARLDYLYEQLSELSRREPTEYYVSVLNDWLQQLNTDKLNDKIGSRLISIGTANDILDDDILNDLFNQSPEFKSWFEKNHLYKEGFNTETFKPEMKWERIFVWNIIRPNDPNHSEKTIIKHEDGSEEPIDGVPVSKYWARVINDKDSFGNPIETKQIVGVTIDNRGNWLPKELSNSPYRNEKYYSLSADEKELLEKLTKYHLTNQQGLDRKSKLYLDFPRFRKSALEAVETTNVAKEKWNALTIFAKRMKNFWTGAKDDAQSGFNEKDEFNLIQADIFDNEVTSVPIAGLYDIEQQDISTDITSILSRYMLSAERQKQLVKISPVARAIQSVVSDPRNTIKLDQHTKTNFITKTIQRFRKKKDVSIRAKTVDNFVEREFEGQNLTGFTKDIPWLNNAQNVLFKRASFGFFALNIPGALKNAFGAKFQGMIYASAGTDMNHLTFAQGEASSLKTMMEISGQIYNKGPKSLDVQITELFDPAQGRFEDKIGESISRTITKDVASFSWLYNFRKWTELQATMQIFFGMMHHKIVQQTQADGSIKKIDYKSAWEVKEGKIQLKAGIDPTWGITYNEAGEIQVGAEYVAFRNRMHQVMNNLQGAYAKFDQPEAQRYLLFRFVSYLRKWFTPMLVNRWGYSGKWYDPKPRLNPGMGDLQMGYYMNFLKTMKETFRSLGKNLPYMTPVEKKAAMQVMTEIGALIVITMLLGLLFGWDPDDEDRFKKLRAKSDAMSFSPFTADDPSRDFNGWGWLENHALNLMMQVRAENEQFLPFPSFGLDDYSAMVDMKSISFRPTIQNYLQIVEDMVTMVSGDDKAYYERNMGPYKWQQQGGAKIWSHLATIVGMTGSSLDPAKAVKGFETSQNLK